jgi:hypothetical protein
MRGILSGTLVAIHLRTKKYLYSAIKIQTLMLPIFWDEGTGCHVADSIYYDQYC